MAIGAERIAGRERTADGDDFFDAGFQDDEFEAGDFFADGIFGDLGVCGEDGERESGGGDESHAGAGGGAREEGETERGGERICCIFPRLIWV